jgi:hypothetical protein
MKPFLKSSLILIALASLPQFMPTHPLISSATAQQDYGWNEDVPKALKGTWMQQGYKCDDKKGELLIISDGGYRWRQPSGSFGYARGRFSKSVDGYSFYFLLNSTESTSTRPDFQISVAGNSLSKYSLGNGESRRYDRCS